MKNKWFLEEYKKMLTIIEGDNVWNDLIDKFELKCSKKGWIHYDWEYYIKNTYCMSYYVEGGKESIPRELIDSKLKNINYLYVNVYEIPIFKIYVNDFICNYEEILLFDRQGILLMSNDGQLILETNKKFELFSNFEISPNSKLENYSNLDWY